MPKQMSGKTFSSLLDYYVACLEHEEMLAVTFAISSEGTQFVSTPLTQEELFHTDSLEVTFENTLETQRFFQTSLPRQKQKTLFYGYPVMISPEGKLSPLFYSELSFEEKNDTISIRKLEPQPRLNPYVFLHNGFDAEEALRIVQDVETEGFANALSSICELFHGEPTVLCRELDRRPLRHTITPTLVNKTILYFGERTGITHNLITELRQLQKKPLDNLASTLLLLLLTGEFPGEQTLQTNKPFLEVFLLNPAQEQAVRQALTKSLTVITGPPGTGKSQVVLNIIANAVYQNKTVLFASKNNKAVDVVIYKFHAILPAKLIVRMGHRAHRRNAKTDLTRLITEDFPRPLLPEKTLSDLWLLASQIHSMQDNLTRLNALNQSIDTIQSMIETLAEQVPRDVYEEGRRYRFEHIDLATLMQDFEKYFDLKGFFRRFTTSRQKRNQEDCLKRYLDLLPSGLRIYLRNHMVCKNTSNHDVVQWVLTWKKIEVATDEIQQIRQKLLTLSDYHTLKTQLRSLHEKHLANSRPVLEQYWMNKLAGLSEEDKQSVLDYFSASEQLESWTGDATVFRQLQSMQVRAFQKILRFLPVWVVTNLSAKQSFPLKTNLFDILIIDEASQCDIVSAIPLLYRAKQVVIIGDPQQLSHISLLTALQDRSLAVQHNLAEEWFDAFSYTKHSLYALVERIAKDNNEVPVLLNEHYRCHSDIITFSNEYYYQRKLTIATDESRLFSHPSLPTPITWFQVKGKTVHAKSPYNTEEAEKVVEEILKILTATQQEKVSLGVVTLFRAQTEMIAEKLNTFQGIYDTNIAIGTAHRFQGDEKDIIIFSPAVSEGVKPGTLHWIESTSQLLNVAVTRARSYLIIVGDRDICSQSNGPLNNLVEHACARMRNSGSFDSPIKQKFYDEIRRQKIPISSHYLIKGTPPIHLDFALFVNGCRYAIEIMDDQEKTSATRLKDEGWRIRRFPEHDITYNLSCVIEEIKRFC